LLHHPGRRAIAAFSRARTLTLVFVGIRMRPLDAATWQRLAATRHAYEPAPSTIDLVALEAETDPRRRLHAEVALIQAFVDALEPQRVSR
jgi:hypothetical protein